MPLAPWLFLLISYLPQGDGQTGATTLQHGMVKTLSDHTQRAWDTEQLQWVTLEQFWLNYARERGGLTWGKRKDYPAYEQVKELDTLLIEIDGKTCLMEFFHQRWRRANDVRRWHPAFNEYGACPFVFD